ncbi:MAG: hypothetical protein A2Y40_07935 [Candidatus Margulisbacteria bacterium GWF2_35_9]|nr:MAG: hypothetical protein A2Y40_07935 [Candidatus Margulisbacteria bacterium GWF2_35_9]
MKKTLILLLLLPILFGAPSLLGTNGLINMPAATSIKYKEFDFGLNWELLQQALSNGSHHQINYFANLGIFDGVELGFIGNNIKEGVFISAKYYMLSDKSEYPLGLAAGMTNLSSHTNTDLYLVLSKKFPNKLAGHLGFKSNILAGKISSTVMFGVEMLMSQYLTVIGDLIGSEDTWVLSSGVRLKVMDDMLLNVYLADIGNNTQNKMTFSIGVSWHNIL